MATRGRPPGSTKTGGRVKGKSIDRGERQLVTSQMAGDIMAVYEQLGGAEWLLKFAKANPKEFIQQGLSRLFPAAQRDADDPGVQVNTQVNIGSDFDAARRIAFALAKATHEQEQQLPPAIEAVRVTSSRPAPEPEPETSPQEACRWGAPDQPNPSPLQDDLEREMARERWAASLHLTPQERAANALIRDTIECDITNYHGSAAEQPGGSVPRPAPRQLTPGERRRAVMSRRGRDLL